MVLRSGEYVKIREYYCQHCSLRSLAVELYFQKHPQSFIGHRKCTSASTVHVYLANKSGPSLGQCDVSHDLNSLRAESRSRTSTSTKY
jgi:hypothetical protein